MFSRVFRFPAPFSVISATFNDTLARFRLFDQSFSVTTTTTTVLHVRVPVTPLAESGTGTYFRSSLYGRPRAAFTLGKEVRTTVPEVPALSPLGLAILGSLLLGLAGATAHVLTRRRG